MALLQRSFKIVSVLRNQRGFTIWLTGISASGKTTIALELEKELLCNRRAAAYVLDGDSIRCGLNRDLDFSEQGRKESIRRVAEVAKLFARSTCIAIVSFISPFREGREAARQIHKEPNPEGTTSLPFVEVFVDIPLEVAKQRDPKGLYKKAQEGAIEEFTGVSAPYETPQTPEVHIRSDELSIQEVVGKILAYLDARKYFPHQ